MAEHRGVSFRTNRQLANPSYSMIRSHSDVSDHRIFDSSFRILSTVRYRLHLRRADSRYILKERPELNYHESSIPLYTAD